MSKRFPHGHVCGVEGCQRQAPRTTMCDMHRKRVSRHGDPGSAMATEHPKVACVIPACTETARTTGLCSTHYMRLWCNRFTCPRRGAFRHLRTKCHPSITAV